MEVQFKCGNCDVPEPNILGIVQRFDSCSSCGFNRYCSKECQTKHWKKVHKNFCSKIPKTSKTEMNLIAATQTKLINHIRNSPHARNWLTKSRKKAKQSKNKKGIYLLSYPSVEDAIKALDTPITGMGWVDVAEINREGLYYGLRGAVDAGCSTHTFTVAMCISQSGFVACVIDLYRAQVQTQNPFDPTFHRDDVLLEYKNVFIHRAVMDENDGRKIAAKFIKSGIQAMGLRTPKSIKKGLDEYVKENKLYHAHVIGDEIVFVFVCRPILDGTFQPVDFFCEYLDQVMDECESIKRSVVFM